MDATPRPMARNISTSPHTGTETPAGDSRKEGRLFDMKKNNATAVIIAGTMRGDRMKALKRFLPKKRPRERPLPTLRPI